MENCIFCKIANGEIPSERVYENDFVFVIKYLHPKAPKLLLLIPKVHIENFASLKDEALAMELYHAIHEVVRQQEMTNFKLHVNNGAGAGQEVMHLHIHIMGY